MDSEKKRIYEPCIDNLAEKYNFKYPNRDFEVIGLWFGSRGTISKFVQEFFFKFNLNPIHLNDISELILKRSIHIINNHIYKVN